MFRELILPRSSYEVIPGPHALSLLFSILALASLFDLGRPPYSIEAHEYYILSRVALEFSSPCATATLQTVSALVRPFSKRDGSMIATPVGQANNIQWLDLSNLQMDPSWTYTLAGLGVRLAYRVSASWTM